MADESISIISVRDRERWEAEHRVGGLPSQSWGYAHALAASGIDPKLAVVRSPDSRMLMPFFERTWNGSIDIATTIGLSGASVAPSSLAPLSLWRQHAAGQDWVAGYIRLATSVDVDDGVPEIAPVPNRSVFLLDLTRDVLRSASEIVRRKVRRAERAGVVAVDDRRVVAESLKRLYPGTMSRVGAGPQYDYPPPTLERWALDPTSVVLGAAVGDSVEAVSVFCVAGQEAEYHVNGSTPRGREFATWLIWEAILRLRERGVRVLNLGGAATRPGDGVYRFKERFKGVQKTAYAVRHVYDRRAYDELCRRAGAAPSDGWFPAYRARRPGAG